MKHKVLAACTVLGLMAPACASHAASVLTGSLPAWQHAVGVWAETANFGAPKDVWISGFTTTNGVVVSVDNVVRQIGQGWSTWSAGYAGQVLADYNSSVVQFGVESPARGMGFFIEPDPMAVEYVTLTTSNGLSLTQPVNGNSGAAFFGWLGSGVTGFTISSPDDFAVGDFFSAISTVPEPSSWAMIFMGLGGLGAACRLSRRRLARAQA